MAKAKTPKAMKLKPFQKLLTVMISGKPVTVDEIDSLLGKEIQMYRLSTYIWHIKTHAEGVVKAIKDGRKVTAYQIVNVAEVKKYMTRIGMTKAPVMKLEDLKAELVVDPIVAVTPTPAPVAEPTMQITEITE